MDSTTLITKPEDPQTLKEAITSLRNLEDEVQKVSQVIRRKGKELIVLRFRQGRVADRASAMPRDEAYGEQILKTLAREAGINNPSTLYRARQFYRHPQFGGSEAALQQWITEKEEEKGRSLTWSYCRNFVRKRLDDGEDDPKTRLKEEAKKLEQSAERTESHAMDLAEEVERLHQNGEVDEDMVAEAEGVLAKAHQAIEDAKRQAEWMEVPKTGRVVSKKYRDYIKSYTCLICEGKGVDPHHIRSSGTAQTDHDVFTVPLCRKHHDEWHAMTGPDFCREYDIDPWKLVAFFLAQYITGTDLT